MEMFDVDKDGSLDVIEFATLFTSQAAGLNGTSQAAGLNDE